MGIKTKLSELLIISGLSITSWVSYGAPGLLQGEAEVLLYDNFSEKTSRTEYFIHINAQGFNKGEKLKLTDAFGLTGSADNLLRGIKTGDEIQVFCLNGSEGPECQVQSLEVLSRNPLSATGVRTSLWMIVDVNDVNNPYDLNYVEGKMDMNRSWYQQASYGQLDFIKDADQNSQPDIVRVAIDYDKSVDGCNAGKIASLAVAAASQQGIDMSLFRHRVFILPALSCGWGGLGHLGCGSSCNSWIASVGWNLVYPHELGHNLGMHHAATDPENDGQVNSEYGDGSCPMGNRLSQGFFNGAHTHQMGWLSEADGHISMNAGAGEYQLRALSLPRADGETSVVHFNHGGKNYYLSYRPSSDFDRISSSYQKGFSVHGYDGGKSRTRYIGTFDENSEFSINDLKVKLLSKDSDYASIKISNTSSGSVISTTELNKRLYPPEIHSSVINFSSTVSVGHVDLISDWWLKRPTSIKVYENRDGQKGELLAEKEFLTYDKQVCGDDYQSLCSYPDAPHSRLSLELGGRSVAGIIVDIEGLLSAGNKFALLKKIIVRD